MDPRSVGFAFQHNKSCSACIYCHFCIGMHVLPFLILIHNYAHYYFGKIDVNK
jgi:hypothetical protein